jgi:hypothetical protein
MMGPFSSTYGTWESVDMRSNGCTMRYPLTNCCPPSPLVMALPQPTAPASAPSTQPSRLSACLATPTTPAISSHPGSYRPATSLRSPLMISLPCSRPPPPVGGSTTSLTSHRPPLEHSPCRSVTFGSMGGEYTLPAQPTMPSEGAPQTGCPSSLAQPSLPAHATTHLLLLDCPTPPPPTGQGGRSPNHTLLTVGESGALAACRACALDRKIQRLAYKLSQGFADTNPWVVNALYAVALKLQCWYQ